MKRTIETNSDFSNFVTATSSENHTTMYSGNYPQNSDDIICLADMFHDPVTGSWDIVETYVSTIPSVVKAMRSFHEMQYFLTYGIEC